MALKKHGINVTPHEYWHEWDIPTCQAAINMAGFSKEVEDWIWEKNYAPFELIRG